MAIEEDMIVATLSRTLYVETDKKAMECSFRFLEFVNAIYVGEVSKVPRPKLFEITHSSIKQVPSKGARARKGLGKRLQSMLKSIAVIQKKDKFGLRYKPDKRERQRLLKRKKRRESPAFSGRRKKTQE